METNMTNLSWLCFVLPFITIILIAIWSMHHRLRYAQRIIDAKARGAFDDMETPEQQLHFRWFALTALVGMVGLLASLILFALQVFNMISIPTWISIASFCISGAFGTLGGLLMQREIRRRL